MIHFYLNSYKTPACKVICTEIVTQELAHRSSANFPADQIVCEPLQNQTSPVLLFLSGKFPTPIEGEGGGDKTNMSNSTYFSGMRSKRSRFTLGVWGLRVRSLDTAFTVTTVRNRPRDCHMAVPMVSSAEVVIFGGFKRLVASFRVAGVALRDIQRCFVTCRKSFCVVGAILLRRFQKMCGSFRGRRSTLDVCIVIFRRRRTTLDVSCWVFFANRIGRAASSGDKLQIPWQAWHFVTCAEN